MMLLCFWSGIFSFLLLPVIFENSGYSKSAIGMLLGTIPIGTLLGRVLVPRLYNHLSIRNLFRSGLLIFVVLLIGYASLEKFFLFFPLFIIHGFLISIFDLGFPEWVYFHYSGAEEHGNGFNFISIWPSIAFGIGPFLSGYVYKNHGTIPLFIFIACCFLAACGLSHFIQLPAHKHVQKTTMSWNIIGKKENWLCFFTMFIFGFVSSSNNTFLFLLSAERAFFTNPGFYFTVLALGVFSSKMIGIWLFRRTQGYQLIFVVCLCLGILQLFLPNIGQRILFIPVLFISGLFLGIVIPYLMQKVHSFNQNNHRYSIAFLFAMLDIGVMTGNHVTGYLIRVTGKMQTLLTSWAGCYIICSLLILFYRHYLGKNVPKEDLKPML